MKHFLDVGHLSPDAAMALITRGLWLKQATSYPSYPRKTLANLFYEASTRTRTSFELAAKNLNLSVVNVDIQRSSECKGEVSDDTLKILAAMGVHLVVIRHAEEGLPQALAMRAPPSLQVINAGDGAHAHPTQAMLDMMTLVERKPCFPDLKIAIVGDIRHSRVANSFQAMCQLLHVRDLVFVAPTQWLPMQTIYGRATTSLEDGLTDADVVMTLRAQRERLADCDQVNLDDYRHDYAITQHAMMHAQPDAIVMHPGPLNRGIEIDSEVADGPQSCIWEQVRNGVFMRMAIVEYLLEAGAH